MIIVIVVVCLVSAGIIYGLMASKGITFNDIVQGILTGINGIKQ